MVRKFISKLRDKFSRSDDFDLPGEADEGYVEIPAEGMAPPEKSKITVRPFVLEEFGDVKPVLDALREGYTIGLINIRPLKDKDLVELKRAINKLKKTCDAIDGDIAGFGENWIAAVPSFASIHRGKPKEPKKKEVSEVSEYSE